MKIKERMNILKITGTLLAFLCFILPWTGATRSFNVIQLGEDGATDFGDNHIEVLRFSPVRNPASLKPLEISDTPKVKEEPGESNQLLTPKLREIFPIDARLESKVRFWIRVYSELTTAEGVLHDTKNPDIIYKNLNFNEFSDFTLSNREKEKIIEKKVKSEKEHLKQLLLSIHKKQYSNETLTTEEKNIVDLMVDIDEPNKYLDAAHMKRIRFQLGQKDRFIQGVFYSGRYLKIMEKIFKERGLPVELTRLPFVESSFNLRARSKVGASGIWQFMRSTGKLFLKINDTVDERNDPIRATQAAAELLGGNYEALNSWPLALTAYNHGRLGMVRAVAKVKSNNLVDIIERYKSNTFGFASGNFYAEFLATLEVTSNLKKYFGNIETDRTVEFAEFIMTDHVDLQDLAIYSKIPLDVLQELNPGLTDLVLKSKKLVPIGFVLRIPMEERDNFLVRYSEIPPYKKFSYQRSEEKSYVLRE